MTGLGTAVTRGMLGDGKIYARAVGRSASVDLVVTK